MVFSIRKLFFISIFNTCLFLMLIIGIQNSSNKNKVKFLSKETIELPLSFIVGSGFISGSLLGSILNTNYLSKKYQEDSTKQ